MNQPIRFVINPEAVKEALERGHHLEVTVYNRTTYRVIVVPPEKK